MHSDVVEHEDEGNKEGGRAENTAEEFGGIDTIEDSGLTNTLRLDTGDGEIFFFLSEPAGRFRSIGQSEESNDANADSDDAFDEENHAPCTESSNAMKCKNPRCEKTTKRAWVEVS